MAVVATGVLLALPGEKVGQREDEEKAAVEAANQKKNSDKGDTAEEGNKAENKVGDYLSKKAPNQVKPGTRQLKGQYVDDLGRVQEWEAHYDEYGRLIGRTDYNAGNKAQGIPDTHYHTYEWGPGKTPFESGSHIEGEYKP